MFIKYALFSLFLVCFFYSKGQQTDSVLKKIFYGLDFTLSASTNADLLRKDPRFTSVPESFVYYYYGKISNDGIVDIKSDSVILFILWGSGSSVRGSHSDESLPSIHYTIFTTTLKYHYQLKDSLNKAYDNVLSFLHLNHIELLNKTDHRGNPAKRITFEEPYLVEKNTLKKIEKYKGTHSMGLYPSLSISKKDGYLQIEFEQYVVRDK